MGLNPTLEALSAQLLVMLFALATYSVVQRNSRLPGDDKKAMHSAKLDPRKRSKWSLLLEADMERAVITKAGFEYAQPMS